MVTIMQGDALELQGQLPSESVNCIVTSPPYWGLRDYGVEGQLGLEETPELYVEKLVEVFHRLRRVLRASGTLWLNLGDSYASGDRATYRSGASENKSQDIQNDMPRPKTPPGLKPKDLVGIPWRVAFALQAAGWWLRSDIIWSKPNPMPESVTDRPTKAHEYVFMLAKSERYYFDADAIKEPCAWPNGPNSPQSIASPYGQGSTRRATKHRSVEPARGDGVNGGGSQAAGSISFPTDFRNARSVWPISTEPFPEAHFATMPTELARRCILAGSPRGGTVLDPFAGAGTTGLVADRLARHFIGFELNPEYAEMAKRRIRNDAPLFAEVNAK
jgi:DNA modification methylase